MGDGFPFEGANEATVMLIADRIFAGLGFFTWPERRIYDDKSQKADLWAESPTGSHSFLVEGKIVWDGGDNRLNRKRFFGDRELLGDFERLCSLTRPARKVAIWVGFSASRELARAADAAKTMRLGDALAAVETEFPTASLQGRTCVDFERFCDSPQWKFGHVFCWNIG